MQTIVVLFVLLATAFAAPQYWQFSGTTNTSTATAIPATSSNVEGGGSCTPGSTATPYENITVTITIPGAYFVYGMFGRPAIDSGYVNIYTTYTPANPCTAIVANAPAATGGGPHVYVPITLSAGTYTFVITTSVATAGGAWSLHIAQADFSGNTNGGLKWWVVPETSDTDSDTFSVCANGTDGTIAQYLNYTWTQTTTGLYDINIFFGNTTVDSPDFVAALYNTTQTWVGTGTETSPAGPCLDAAGFYLGTVNDDSVARVTAGFGTAGVIPTIMLTAGTTYTIVVSGTDYTEIGPFGGRIAPTVYYQVGTNANFPAPEPETAPADCVNDVSGASLKVWRAFVITAQFPTYVVDTGPTDIGFDTISALYVGNNAGSADYSVPPSACTNYLQCVDTGDVGPLSASGLVVGMNYTVVVTTYSDSAPTDLWFTLWAFTGNSTGIIPTPPTSGSKTTATGAATAGATAGSTTGSAQTIAASFLLALLGVAFALQF